MLFRLRVFALIALLASASLAVAKKKKIILPAYVLQAKYVLVIIDPNSGVSPADPLANRKAVEDVERSLTTWGRYEPVISGTTADLIIVVRKGSGKVVQPTIGGIPTDGRPVILQPSDGGIRVGGQKGQDPGNPGQQTDPGNGRPEPQVEMGSPDDTFEVYQAQTGGDVLDAPPAWRYSAKNGLHSPDVPAVAEFRKAVEESEKELNEAQKKKQPSNQQQPQQQTQQPQPQQQSNPNPNP
jgi:hypothetical protein